MKYLCESSLDFGIRSGGLGSSSAKDVVVSMSAFDDVVFSPEDETVLIGAGKHGVMLIGNWRMWLQDMLAGDMF